MGVINATTLSQRSAKYDNLKALLIFLVVFGHMLVITPGIIPRFLYMIMYIFHMPAFIYVTGKFTKPKKEKIGYLLSLYVVFQVIYTLFLQRFYNPATPWTFIDPHWILWYLITMIFYTILSFFLPSSPSPLQKKLGIFISFLIALVAGFFSFIGPTLSLSRTLVFLPFFLMGKWEGKGVKREKGEKKSERSKKFSTLLHSVLTAFMSFACILVCGVNREAVYHDLCYAEAGSSWYIRLLVMVTAVLWIKLLLRIIPDKPIPVITDIGKSTLVIFLGHGFIVRLIRYFGLSSSIYVALISAIVIVTVLYLMRFSFKKLQNFVNKKFRSF